MAKKHVATVATPKKIAVATKVTEHRLFPVQIRALAVAAAVASGLSPDDAVIRLADVDDEDIRELSEEFGVNDDRLPQEGDGSGHVEVNREAGDEGPFQARGDMLKSLLARLANIDPAIKKKIVDAILRLVGIIV